MKTESSLSKDCFFTHSTENILVEQVKDSTDEFSFKIENTPAWCKETILNKVLKKLVWGVAWIITLFQMYNVFSERLVFTLEGFKSSSSETSEWLVCASIFVPLVFLPAIALILSLVIEAGSFIFIDFHNPKYRATYIARLPKNVQKHLKNFNAATIYRYVKIRDEAESKTKKLKELEVLLVKTSDNFALRNETKIKIVNLCNNIDQLVHEADRVLIDEARKIENKAIEEENQRKIKAEEEILYILVNEDENDKAA